MTEDLQRFVRKALEKNVSRDKIAAALKQARWRDEEIKTVLAAFADDPGVGLPVPRRKASLSASEAFQYLTIFLCLAICAFAGGNLLFNLVDAWVPDPQNPYLTWSRSEVRLAIASLIVALPVYLFMSYGAWQAARRDPLKRESPVRKWLTYLTLFATGGVAIGDLIALLDQFFSGDLATRFFCKALIVLLIAGKIFVLYLWDLRRDERAR
ncbi:MAG TPA: DUF5671 domain-containing protein [Candidatus Binatia bacterium]|jgi:hypothetical protein|nr:DUF5671 domain-containing protein [Candidatus Binatia bacterium]